MMNYLVPSNIQGTADLKWVDFLTNKYLSAFIFRHTGKICDAPYYQNGKFIHGKNLTIGLLVSSLAEFNEYRRGILDELDYVLEKCDPNIFDSDQPLSPLQTAILHKEMVATHRLLKAGANHKLVITRPGKPIDGMNALQFAQHLESKAAESAAKKEYGEIAELIRKYNGMHQQWRRLSE